MYSHTTRQIAEFGHILSQVLNDVIEHNYLLEHAALPLTKTQFTILKIIAIAGPYTVSEIADILQVSRAAASKNIDKLVKIHLIRRRVTARDRRTAEITLSDKGVALIREYETLRLKKQSDALADFTDQEKVVFLSLLRRYIGNCLGQENKIDLVCLQCNGSFREQCALGNHRERCRFYFKFSNEPSNH